MISMSQVPSDVLSGLLADKEALTKVLLTHVVSGANVFSKGVMWAETETAGGGGECCHSGVQEGRDQGESDIRHHVPSAVCQVVSVTEDGTRTAARVVDPDIAATNGVVHAIYFIYLFYHLHKINKKYNEYIAPH